MRTVDEQRVEAIFAYVALYAVVVGLGLPGALMLTLLGGYLFGWVMGAMVALLGACAGAVLVFLLTRFAFAEIIRRRLSGRLALLAKGFAADAASYLLFLRLVPIFPFALVNLAAALLGAPFLTFCWTTLVGIVPGTLTFAVTGAGLQKAVENETARLAACRATQGVACAAKLDPASLIGTETIAALTLLSLLALMPVLGRRFLRYRAPNIAPAPDDGPGEGSGKT